MDSTASATPENTPSSGPDGAQAQIAALQAELKHRDLKIQKLVLELAYYKRLRYGVKSEAMTSVQRELFGEAAEEDVAEITNQIEQETPPIKPAQKRPGRNPLPADLPRIEHRHEPESCTCGECGTALVKIGEDVSEQLDCEPTRFFVHRHIRPQYACRECETVTAAEVPPALVDGGMAAPGLYAWVVIQKYLDHLPLYRIEEISARNGVPIARSTLTQWVGQIGVSLAPLADRLAELLKRGDVLHADETPVQQLDPGTGKTHRSYLWAYRSNELSRGPPIVVFDYQTSRSGAHARTFLDGWSGKLMVDDYKGYKSLFKKEVIELGCMAHARRNFHKLWDANKHPVAEEALKRFGKLYEIEADGRALNIDGRHALRQEKATPLLKLMHEWLQEERLRTANGSALASAIDYSLKRWSALARYVERGDYPIDNNPVENAIRPVCLGKKNWLFVGSERAGRRAAAIQSLLGTAKLNGIEPFAWLKGVLEKLPAWPHSRIDELLPIDPAQQPNLVKAAS